MDLSERATQFRVKLNRLLYAAGFPRDWFLVPMAAVIGALAGLAARGYGELVHLSERTFYTSGHSVGVLQWWLLLALPIGGALLVGLIKTLFRLPLFSHGVPEVIESLARRRGHLPLRTGIFTAVNSAITIGSGGSAGQEGPIVHIGSVIGSVVGLGLRVGREHMSTLIGCGAAAGLAAIFKAPMAGVLLVLEVILRDFSFRTFMPIVIAAVIGVAVSQGFAGTGEAAGALFSMPKEMMSYQFSLGETVPYLLLGVICGLLGYCFTMSLSRMEQFWAARRWPLVLKPVSGAVLLGLMGMAMIWAFPQQIAHYRPTFFANGYPVIQTLLDPRSYEAAADPTARLTFLFLVLVAACKLIGTSLTLGSGGSGGLFAPSLFIGAATGAAYGTVLRAAHAAGLQTSGIFPNSTPAAYALAGMAGILAGAVHCPLTAIILVFEITRDYTVIMPIMLVAISATTVAQLLLRDSIYTKVLKDMGLDTSALSDSAVLRRIDVSQVALAPACPVRPEDPAQRLVDLAGNQQTFDFVVVNEQGKYLGMIVGEDIRMALLDREAIPLMIVAEMIHTELPTVTPYDTLDVVLDKLARHDVLSLAVLEENGTVLGMITRSRVMRTYMRSVEKS